ncbi:PAS domain S-box protein [Desulfosarcina sp. BuS5]|uniref:PAS domain S-box protein n=1 Tax=Desulfosarcina sp. BuS5 TaxID=933262 RepID=UPI000685E9FB|nr:PAS domain S-box protein [Desulfosarcina sp. BuS5]
MTGKPTYDKSKPGKKKSKKKKKKKKKKISLIIALLAVCCFLLYYFHYVLEIGTGFTHFFYVPIILASLWWQRKGLGVTLLLAILLLFTHYFLRDPIGAGNDYFRAFMFVSVGFVAALVSERIVKKNESLRESEGKFKSLFENMKSGVAVYEAENNGKDFIFKDLNKAGEQIDKIARGELIGKSVLEIFPSIKDFGLFDVLQRVWKTGQPEHHPITIYKDERITGWRENDIYKLPSGEIVAVYDDVSERKQMEEALQKNERNLSITLNSIGDAVIATDTKGRVTRMNPIAEKLTGWNLSEAKGRPLIEVFNIINEETRKQMKSPAEKVMREGTIVGLANHTVLISKNGTETPIADSGAPIKNDQGDIFGIILVFRDISEKIEAEKQKKKLEAEAMRTGQLVSIGEIAAGVAHEINNPINSVINLAQILLDECNSESSEYDIAGRIIKEGDRIANIVSNLLSFARGNMEKEKNLVNLSEIISDTLVLAKVQMQKDQIELRVNIPLNLPKIIANPQQIQQVFLNLIINARYALNQKYSGTHENKILEILGEEATIDDCPYVRAIFQDNGIGIPANEIKKVINPFYSTKPTGIGTGLGLSISHGIISDHGGYIRIESTEGEFTRVIIDLPASGKEKR